MSRPAVSITTIFRDGLPYLQEAVDSVLAQTFEDWELLLVDDGSTDGSGELARQLAGAHPDRLRYLTHPDRGNHGMSASRNVGLRSARGRTVAFLDADDVYLPQKLAVQLPLLDAHPDVDMVHGPMTLWNSWADGAADPDRVRPLRLPVGVVLSPPAVLRAYVRGRAGTPATCSVLMRRELPARVGWFEPRFSGLYEDQVFFHKVALHARILLTEEPTDLYRQHPASATAQSLASGTWARKGSSPTNLAFLEWLDTYLSEPGGADVLTRLTVRRHLLLNRHPSLALPGEVARRIVGRLRHRRR